MTEPSNSKRDPRLPCVVLINSGIVHRTGPNRVYVKLARHLAGLGMTTLRFDLSGIGDSPVREDSLPMLESAPAETCQVMDTLHEELGFKRFVLAGLCSGAGFAFRAATEQKRAVGVALINAAGHRWGSEEEYRSAMTRHYWRIALRSSFRRKTWSKAARTRFDKGLLWKVAGLRMKSLFSRGRRGRFEAGRVSDEMRALVAQGTRLLFIYSEGDEGLDHYRRYLSGTAEALARENQVSLDVVSGANHVFTLHCHQDRLLAILGEWAKSLTGE